MKLRVILFVLLLLALGTGCSQTNKPSDESSSSLAAPVASSESAELSTSDSSLVENETYRDSTEYRFASELYEERGEELLTLVNQRMASYRDGSFEEMENHHPPYPDDFPDLALLPDSYTMGDIFIAWRATKETQDPNVTLDGSVEVIVPVDDTHALTLEPNLFGSADGSTTLGFGNSGFVDVSFAGFSDIDQWLADSQGFAADGIMGQ